MLNDDNNNYDCVCDDYGMLKRNGYDKNINSSRKIDNKSFMKKVSKRSLWKGLIVMGLVFMVCGRSDDVDLWVFKVSWRIVKVVVVVEVFFRLVVSGKII